VCDPLRFLDNEAAVHEYTCYGLLGSMAVAFLLLMLMPTLTAAYGRYARSGWGHAVNGRLAWCVQESPTFLVGAGLLVGELARGAAPAGARRPAECPVNVVLLSLVLVHYFNRAFLFPCKIRGGKPTPFLIFIMAFWFCAINGYLQGTWLTRLHAYDDAWARDPRFIIGVLVWACGFATNLYSDFLLRRLRRGDEQKKEGKGHYKIPRGGLFRYVSCANYCGEIIEWGGYALATWSLPGLTFFVCTFCNLGPRAHQHHEWYLTQFGEEYRVLGRKAVIPFLW
jgi:hypothetical protein